MVKVVEEFAEALALHIVDASGGEAGRVRVLAEGAAIAMNFMCEYDKLRSGDKPVTPEMLTPEAFPLPTDNPLVDLFYGCIDEHF